MIESLEAIRKAVAEYKESPDPSGDEICDWLRTITTHLFNLAEERANYQKKYQEIIYNGVREREYSVSRAENIAEVQVPELYMLRYVMKAAEDIVQALRSHLSHLKFQANATNNV